MTTDVENPFEQATKDRDYYLNEYERLKEALQRISSSKFHSEYDPVEIANNALKSISQPRKDGCICSGNWRLIVKESEQFIGRTYSYNNDLYTFFGVIHGNDDYYYGMYNQKDKSVMQLSCVGSIEMFGFDLVED